MKRTTNEKQNAELQTLETNSNNVLDFSTTLRELGKTVDLNLIRQRVGGRDRDGNVHMVEYIEWHTVADILDEHAPNWAHTIKDIRPIGEIITVTVAITIDGVTREGVGTGKAASETGIKKAEHDALKRAAVKFGIARELYKREADLTERADAPRLAPARTTGDPTARTLGDMITGKQLGLIRAIARDAQLDPEAAATDIMKCRLDELSKSAASDLIDHLQNLDGRRVEPIRRAG